MDVRHSLYHCFSVSEELHKSWMAHTVESRSQKEMVGKEARLLELGKTVETNGFINIANEDISWYFQCELAFVNKMQLNLHIAHHLLMCSFSHVKELNLLRAPHISCVGKFLFGVHRHLEHVNRWCEFVSRFIIAHHFWVLWDANFGLVLLQNWFWNTVEAFRRANDLSIRPNGHGEALR